MSQVFLFPKLRLFILTCLLVLPLQLMAADDSAEDEDSESDDACAEVILESAGSIKDVLIEKYGRLCLAEESSAKEKNSGKDKKNDKKDYFSTPNCKKLNCLKDKSLQFKFKSSSNEATPSSTDSEASSASEDGNKKGLFGFNDGFEQTLKSKEEATSKSEGKMNLSRCVDEGVDTSVPYSEMSSVQKQCNFIMNSTAGFVDKVRNSDVVTGYLGKSDKKQEQEEKDKLRYVYNNLVQCDNNLSSCGLTKEKAQSIYEKYADSSDPEVRKWAGSMRVLSIGAKAPAPAQERAPSSFSNLGRDAMEYLQRNANWTPEEKDRACKKLRADGECDKPKYAGICIKWDC